MNSHTALVRMVRQGAVLKESPAFQDVFELMEAVKYDKGAPEFLLELLSSQGGDGKPLAVLHFVLMKEIEGDTAGNWLVRHKDQRQRNSFVLASGQPDDSEFIRCLLCGAFALVRTQCFVDGPLVEAAVTWFQNTGDRSPSAIWLDFLDSVRPE